MSLADAVMGGFNLEGGKFVMGNTCHRNASLEGGGADPRNSITMR